MGVVENVLSHSSLSCVPSSFLQLVTIMGRGLSNLRLKLSALAVGIFHPWFRSCEYDCTSAIETMKVKKYTRRLHMLHQHFLIPISISERLHSPRTPRYRDIYHLPLKEDK